MRIRLSPVTREKLEQFGRRRRRLVLARGICSAIVSLLLLMSAIALADWLWVLSDTLRWSLSAAGYAGALMVVWLTCLRLMIRIPRPQDLARRMEMAEPELRENLLSAIELCIDEPRQTNDSPVFRQLVQEQVGRQMACLNVSALLPIRLLGNWLAAAVVIVIVCAVLLSLPGFPFGQLMTRALLPGANIDRVSRVQVAILQPTPHSLTLPQEETVAVIVEITQGTVDEVTLETQTRTKGVRRQQMRPHSPSQSGIVANAGLTPSLAERSCFGRASARTVRRQPHCWRGARRLPHSGRGCRHAKVHDRLTTSTQRTSLPQDLSLSRVC